MAPEKENTQTLYLLSVISSGRALVSAATVPPSPSVTRMIGRAQQTNVPAEANRVNQLRPLSFNRVSLVFVAAVASCSGT